MMSENVNRLFASRHRAVPVFELKLSGDDTDVNQRIREILKSQGIGEPARCEYLSVSDFLKRFFPSQEPDENGETHTSAIIGAGVYVVVSIAVGTVLAFIFYP